MLTESLPKMATGFLEMHKVSNAIIYRHILQRKRISKIGKSNNIYAYFMILLDIRNGGRIFINGKLIF